MNTNKAVTLVSNGEYWAAQWYDDEGKQRRKSIGPKAKVSKTAARRECADIAAQFAVTPAQRNASRSPDLGTWLDHYIKLRSDIGARSLEKQARAISLLKEFFGAVRMDQINRARAAEFQAWLARYTPAPSKFRPKPKPLAPFTVHGHIVVVREIFGWALRLDVTPINPFDRLKMTVPKMEKDWPYVSVEDAAKIIDAAPEHGWRCLVALARYAGLRRGEALRLTWADVGWDTRLLTVRPVGGRATTKARLRYPPMSPALHAVLRAAFEAAPEGGSPLVCAGVSEHGVEKRMRTRIQAAGLEPWNDKPLHTLRKSLETDWLAIHPVLDVTAWLGNSPDVAAAHYHKTKPETIARVTGGKSELEQLREEVAMLRTKLGQEKSA